MNCRDGGEENYKAKNNDGSIYGPDYLDVAILDFDPASWSEGTLDESGREKKIEEFCQKVPSTLAFLEEIFKTCDKPYDSVLVGGSLYSAEENYITTKFYQSYYCSTDTNTGEYCYKIFQDPEEPTYGVEKLKHKFNIRHDLIDTPYRDWDPKYCKSNTCLSQLDAAVNEALNYRYKYNSQPMFKMFAPPTEDNPFKCCGTNDGTIGAKEKCKADPPASNSSSPVKNNNNNSISGNSTSDMGNITSDATTLSAQITLLSLIICLIFALFK